MGQIAEKVALVHQACQGRLLWIKAEPNRLGWAPS
jgi:hypothetical protein